MRLPRAPDPRPSAPSVGLSFSPGPGGDDNPTLDRLRGEFIRKAQEKRRDFTVDWVHLKLNDQAQRTVLCKDPFKAVDERVDKLIASM